MYYFIFMNHILLSYFSWLHNVYQSSGRNGLISFLFWFVCLYVLILFMTILKTLTSVMGTTLQSAWLAQAPSFISFVHMHEKAPAFVSGMMGQQVIILVTFRSFSARRLRNCLVNSVSLGCQNMSFCPILRPAKYFY